MGDRATLRNTAILRQPMGGVEASFSHSPKSTNFGNILRLSEPPVGYQPNKNSYFYLILAEAEKR